MVIKRVENEVRWTLESNGSRCSDDSSGGSKSLGCETNRRKTGVAAVAVEFQIKRSHCYYCCHCHCF
ncbi:hypothetical protein PGB90_006368 [Kerria lacca]